MAYSVTFTMQAQYTGTTEADNFTIVGKHANGSPADTTIATGVSKANLIAGVTYQVADTITGGTVTSTGTCTNSVNWTGQSSGGGGNPNEPEGSSTVHLFSFCGEGDPSNGINNVYVLQSAYETASGGSAVAIGHAVSFNGAPNAGLWYVYNGTDSETEDPTEMIIKSIDTEDAECTNIP